MAKSKPKVNESLRQWARGVSFTIAMGRRQVYTLISTDLSKDRTYGLATGRSDSFLGDRHPQMRHFITSMHCLVDRGLVAAPIWNGGVKKGEPRLAKYWHLTRAGELVVELLKEAGIYAEVVAELERAERPKLRIA